LQYAYKPDIKKIMPFGLEASAAPVLGEILNEDASLMVSVTGLMAQAKAGGTIISCGECGEEVQGFLRGEELRLPSVYGESGSTLHCTTG
jgi:hypothetical protein